MPGLVARAVVLGRCGAAGQQQDIQRLALVFDGLWAHGLDPKRFTIRHGSNSQKAENRRCNVVFLDGHAESIPGSALPSITSNLYDRPVLNTDENGKWAVSLIVKPVP